MRAAEDCGDVVEVECKFDQKYGIDKENEVEDAEVLVDGFKSAETELVCRFIESVEVEGLTLGT